MHMQFVRSLTVPFQSLKKQILYLTDYSCSSAKTARNKNQSYKLEYDMFYKNNLVMIPQSKEWNG